jgi:hypothetical protein
MIKRKMSSASINNNKKQKVSTSVQSSLSSFVKSQPRKQTLTSETLLNKIENENKELLSLEIKTMNSEWLKVLNDVIQKPYFIEVN